MKFTANSFVNWRDWGVGIGLWVWEGVEVTAQLGPITVSVGLFEIHEEYEEEPEDEPYNPERVQAALVAWKSLRELEAAEEYKKRRAAWGAARNAMNLADWVEYSKELNTTEELTQ